MPLAVLSPRLPGFPVRVARNIVYIGKFNRYFFSCSPPPAGMQWTFSLISCCLYTFTHLNIKLKKWQDIATNLKQRTQKTLAQLLCQSFRKSLKGNHMEKRKHGSKGPHALPSAWTICLHLWVVSGIVWLLELTLLLRSDAKQKWPWVFLFTIMSSYNMVTIK